MGLVLKKLFEGMLIDQHANAMRALAKNWTILSNVAASDWSDVNQSLQYLNDSIALPLDSIWAKNVVFLAMIPDEGMKDPDVLQILNESRLMIPIDCWETSPIVASIENRIEFKYLGEDHAT